MLYISKGNSKVGNIPSISLPPVTTCVTSTPCVKECYAIRISKRFSHVRKQWEHNLYEYIDDSGIYFNTIFKFLDVNKPKYFRFHIGGDCPDKYYTLQVIKICAQFPNTNFLIFTKRYEWFSNISVLSNLFVILSMWPYIKEPQSSFRKTWVRGDLRIIGKELYSCKGKCTECLYCFNNNPLDILLKPH